MADLASFLPFLLGPVDLSIAQSSGKSFLVVWDASAKKYNAVYLPGSSGDLLANSNGGVGSVAMPAGGLVGRMGGRIDDPILAYNGATPASSTGLSGPRVIGSTTWDAGDPVGQGYVFSAVYNTFTASAATIPLAQLALAAGEGLALDAKISCRTSNTLGRYKRAVAYQRIGSAAPTIVGSLETTTDVGSGGTVSVTVSGNNVNVNVTTADATNRLWMIELSVHRLPAVA